MGAYGVKEAITDRDFWTRLEDYLAIFKVIHEQQKSSESTESTIAHVGPRWAKIRAELKAVASTTIPELQSFIAPGGLFDERKAIQSTLLHKAAYWLSPESLGESLKDPEKTEVIQWMLLHLLPGTNQGTFTSSF